MYRLHILPLVAEGGDFGLAKLKQECLSLWRRGA